MAERSAPDLECRLISSNLSWEAAQLRKIARRLDRDQAQVAEFELVRCIDRLNDDLSWLRRHRHEFNAFENLAAGFARA